MAGDRIRPCHWQLNHDSSVKRNLYGVQAISVRVELITMLVHPTRFGSSEHCLQPTPGVRWSYYSISSVREQTNPACAADNMALAPPGPPLIVLRYYYSLYTR